MHQQDPPKSAVQEILNEFEAYFNFTANNSRSVLSETKKYFIYPEESIISDVIMLTYLIYESYERIQDNGLHTLHILFTRQHFITYRVWCPLFGTSRRMEFNRRWILRIPAT